MSIDASKITGVVLAGGRAVRMGGQDKGLLRLHDNYMIEDIIQALRPQVQQIIVNANRHHTLYTQVTNCTVVSDIFGEYAGPLAGMASGLQTAQTEYVLFVPCDSPFITAQLATRLSATLEQFQADICVVEDGQRTQMVFSLMKRTLLADLLIYLQTGGRKVASWYERHHWVCADFSDIPQMFLNVNTPQEYEIALQRSLDIIK